MPTVKQDTKQAQQTINFLVPADFKLEVDLAVTRARTSLRDFCTRAIAERLGIPVPGVDSTVP